MSGCPSVVIAGDSRPSVVIAGDSRPSVVIAGFPGVPGAAGPTGAGLALGGSVATYTDLPTDLTAADQGQTWLTNDDGRAYVWSGSAWPPSGSGPKLQGPAGAHGQIRYTGKGAPPGVIVGANPGDTYLDVTTGDLYKLT